MNFITKLALVAITLILISIQMSYARSNTVLIAMSITSFGAGTAKVIEFSSKAQCHGYLKQKAKSYRINGEGELTGTVGRQVAVCTNNFASPRY